MSSPTARSDTYGRNIVEHLHAVPIENPSEPTQTISLRIINIFPNKSKRFRIDSSLGVYGTYWAACVDHRTEDRCIVMIPSSLLESRHIDDPPEILGWDTEGDLTKFLIYTYTLCLLEDVQVFPIDHRPFQPIFGTASDQPNTKMYVLNPTQRITTEQTRPLLMVGVKNKKWSSPSHHTMLNNKKSIRKLWSVAGEQGLNITKHACEVVYRLPEAPCSSHIRNRLFIMKLVPQDVHPSVPPEIQLKKFLSGVCPSSPATHDANLYHVVFESVQTMAPWCNYQSPIQTQLQ